MKNFFYANAVMILLMTILQKIIFQLLKKKLEKGTFFRMFENIPHEHNMTYHKPKSI